MAFSQSVVDEAWKRSGGYCECRRTNHGHSYTRCHKQLVYENRGKTGQRGCWEAHHITAGGLMLLLTERFFAVSAMQAQDLTVDHKNHGGGRVA